MIISQKAYEKDKNIVYVNDKFVYHDEIYLIWSWGASLLDEKYYSSSKPITLKKKDQKLKKKNSIIYRFLTLEFAPEEYLINNGYKIIDNYETEHC